MRKAITAKAQRNRLTSRTKPQVRPGRAKTASQPLVFLVDDEPVLLDLAGVSLQPAGVLTRKFLDPAQAWRAFQRARAKPQLLISDYSLGKMNGLQLIQKCKTLHPSLKTILVSGNVGAEIILNGQVKIDRFLAKPYPPERLCALVKELLS